MNMIEQIEEMRELLNKYPKTKQLLMEWMTLEVQRMQQMSIPKEQEVEVPPINPEDVEIMLLGQMAFNHRFLYEFFDKQEVYLSVRHSIQSFCSRINDESTAPCFPTRLEAEKDGFLRCLEITEHKLA